MALFGKKKEKPEEEKPEEKEEEKPEPVASAAEGGAKISQITKLSTEIDKLKASVEGFTEIRKSFTERFTRISEQIGELRSMILERDKSIQEIELKAIKAYDLVEAVHPEKIMTEVQKQDAKSEALKANLEGNETIMNRVMEELKETKRKIDFFRGVEEIVKLSEEVKKELIEIKKIESKININADKVETIYSEMRKKYKDIETFSSSLEELKVGSEQSTKDIGFLKDRMTQLVDKGELDKIVRKVQVYIDALKSLEKKSSLTKDVESLRTLLDSLK
jgi:chromosome segregation ATPase